MQSFQVKQRWKKFDEKDMPDILGLELGSCRVNWEEKIEKKKYWKRMPSKVVIYLLWKFAPGQDTVEVFQKVPINASRYDLF